MVLDDEERMVFEGFDHDVRNETVISRRVKGLFTKTKHHKQPLDFSRDMMRTISTNS